MDGDKRFEFIPQALEQAERASGPIPNDLIEQSAGEIFERFTRVVEEVNKGAVAIPKHQSRGFFTDRVVDVRIQRDNPLQQLIHKATATPLPVVKKNPLAGLLQKTGVTAPTPKVKQITILETGIQPDDRLRYRPPTRVTKVTPESIAEQIKDGRVGLHTIERNGFTLLSVAAAQLELRIQEQCSQHTTEAPE